MLACRRAIRFVCRVYAAWIVVAMAAGCSQNIFKTGLVRPGTSPPTPGLSPPVIEGPPLVSMDGVPPMLPPSSQAGMVPAVPGGAAAEAMLAQSREQSTLLKEEVDALRQQLASTSSQLAAARQAGGTGIMPPSSPAADAFARGAAGPQAAAVAKPTIGPADMQAAMGQLNLSDGQARFDGGVVRIEIPSDRLFEGSTAALLPGGAATLSQVASELARVYPNHFIGIEGHLDSEPLPAGAQLPPHQLTAARAAAVFDFFTSRTSLPGRQLFLVAHGPNHPVVSNATAAGRSRNRRIELVVYPETLAPAAGS